MAMICWDDGLKLRDLDCYLDSRRPRRFCFVSHAHGDHLGRHETMLATPATARLAGHRNNLVFCRQAPFDVPLDIGRNHRALLLPAGHVLGSAMLHVSGSEGSLLYTGDFKLRPGLTCEAARTAPADYLLMECTYGRPAFRFPPARAVAQELVERCAAAIAAGRQPIALGYSLGKAQEIVRILTDAGLPVTAHGAVAELCAIYEELGVPLGRVRRYAPGEFHGPGALDLRERGVLVAPPHVARTGFVTRFENPFRVVLTGWAVSPGAPYRYGVDAALPLSDHADFDELLELVERVRPRHVFTHHGFPEFKDELQRRGVSASLARPDAQLRLFD